MKIFKMEEDAEGHFYINVYRVVENDLSKIYTLIDSIPIDEEEEDNINEEGGMNGK